MRKKLREGKKRCEIQMMPFLPKWEILLLKPTTYVLSMQNRNKKRHYESKKQMKLLKTSYNNKPTWKLMATILTYLNRQHCLSWKLKDDSFYLKKRKDIPIVPFYLKTKRCSILFKSKKMFHFADYLFRRKICSNLLSFKWLMLFDLSQSQAPSL